MGPLQSPVQSPSPPLSPGLHSVQHHSATFAMIARQRRDVFKRKLEGDLGFPARICKFFKEPRNRFPAWLAGTTTLFDVTANQATWAVGIDSLELISGLLNRLQIRTLFGKVSRL